ncbi:MAG: DUF559 domain-containing protein [Syntrophobacteraceae bacterium]|nr:DUF559 domain-containing protein [Syntrophobacteraceae bacterium]
MLPFRSSPKPFTRELQKRMTDAEPGSLVWSKVRRKQLDGRVFHWRKGIGSYIADFTCPSAGSVVVELDGGFEKNSPFDVISNGL